MTESLIGRTVRLTGGDLVELWRNEEYIVEAEVGPDVRVRTPHGSLWVGLPGSTMKTMTGELVPEPRSYIGQRVRLTGREWGKWGMPDQGTVHTITHDPGFNSFNECPGINPDGEPAHVYFVIPDDFAAADDERRDWAVEWVADDEADRLDADAVAEDLETAYIAASDQTDAVRSALVAAYLAGLEAGRPTVGQVDITPTGIEAI